jgi:hypothetical protein
MSNRDKAIQLVEDQIVSAEAMLNMALKYMSEGDVADMLDHNELSELFEEEYDGQPDEAQEWYDFDLGCWN